MFRRMSRILIVSTIYLYFGAKVSANTLPQPIDLKAKELFTAIYDGSRNAAKLISNGANLTTKDENGMTPFLAAVQAGNLSIIRKLINTGCDVSARDNKGNNAMLLAVKSGSQAVVRFFIANGGYDINSRNIEGVTPLMIAAEGGGYELLNILLKAKADSNLTNNSGRTLLMFAASSGNLSLMRSLIEQGNADINAVDNTGRPVVSYAMGNGEAVRYLVEAGVDLTRQYAVDEIGYRNITPLIESVVRSNWVAVRSLLQKGADINQSVDYGLSPIVVAALSFQWELLEYLKENGARLDVQLYGLPADKMAYLNGAHPILLAAMNSQEELVCRLLADDSRFANTPSSTGVTPLIVAIARELPDMDACLRKVGAKLSEEQKLLVETMRVSDSRDAAEYFVRRIKTLLDTYQINERTYPVDAHKLFLDSEQNIPDGLRFDYYPVCKGAFCTSYRLQASSEAGRVEFQIDGKAGKISWREPGNSQWTEMPKSENDPD